MGFGLGGHHDQVRENAVGDEGLLAVDDVAVAVTPRAGADGGQVRPGVGLGQADGGDDFTRSRSPGSHRSFDLGGGEGMDVGGCHIAVERDADAETIATDELLVDDDGVLKTQAQTAVFLRQPGAEVPLLTHLDPDAPVVPRVPLPTLKHWG